MPRHSAKAAFLLHCSLLIFNNSAYKRSNLRHNFFIFRGNKTVKKYLLFAFLLSALAVRAQKIDSIYVNLYTDSLKKGTYNYINVDGLLSNGRYLPLDSSHIAFSCSAGKFYGNTLWLDRDCREEKINIKAVLRSNPSVYKEFVIFIKKKEDNERLKTADEIINGMKTGKSKKN